MLYFEKIGNVVDDLYLSVNHRSYSPIVSLERIFLIIRGCIVKI